MIWLRSVVFFSFMLVFTPFYALACFIIFPFVSAANRYEFVRGWNVTIIAAARIVCNIRYEIHGMENVKAMLNEPAIVLSKHQSAWETIAFLAIFPKQLCYVFKRELLWVPFFGWALGMLRMIHIDRSKTSAASNSVAKQGRKYLAQGCWIIIHPEGTRTPVGKHLPYRKGGARLAVATGAAVIPIAHNAGHVWPRNSFMKYPGTVTVSIGSAIPVAGKTAEQVHAEMETWIENEMHRIDPKAYLPK